MIAIDNKKDILLLLLYVPGSTGQINEPIRGRTRLVKMLFLFDKEIFKSFKKDQLPIGDFYKFYSWSYGPFSKDVYDDLTFFILRGFIDENPVSQRMLEEEVVEYSYWRELTEIEDSESIEVFNESQFALTDKGLAYAKELYESLTDDQKGVICEFKRRLNSVGLRRILLYVYNQYPEFTEKSVIRDGLIK